MNQEFYADMPRCRLDGRACSSSTTSCRARLDRSAKGNEGQLISQVTLTRTSTVAVPASIGTSLANSMRVAIGA